jgi:hypothetical protein
MTAIQSLAGLLEYLPAVVGYMDHHEGFFVGSFTFALFLATWFLWRSTHKLWAAGEKQLVATGKLADATVIMAASDRAWMIFKELQFADVSDSFLSGVHFKRGIAIFPFWWNKGKSPAINATIFCEHRIIETSATDIPTFIADFTGNPGSAPVGSDSPVRGPARLVIDADRDKIFAQTHSIIVYSHVAYQDIFNPSATRHSEVCLRVVFPGYISNAEGKMEPNWQITVVGPQNTAT